VQRHAAHSDIHSARTQALDSRPVCGGFSERLSPPTGPVDDQFERLPGIGPSHGQRLPGTCSGSPKNRSMPSPWRASARLFHLSAEPFARSCLNETRRNGQLCVVADSREPASLCMRAPGNSRGIYVLGGLISPMDGVGPEPPACHRWCSGWTSGTNQRGDPTADPDVEVNTTSLYLARRCRPYHPCQQDRLRACR